VGAYTLTFLYASETHQRRVSYDVRYGLEVVHRQGSIMPPVVEKGLWDASAFLGAV
jgi:hypothetical protein